MPTTAAFAQAKSLVRALHGEVQARPPFWFMRQAGRYLPEYREIRAKAKDFVALCLNPDLATEITLQPVRRFAMDAAILFSDILIVPYGLGRRLEFKEGEGPVLEPVRTAAEIAAMKAILANDTFLPKVAPVFETVRRTVADLPLDTALIGFAGAPWTVACYMIEGHGGGDFGSARKLARTDPALFESLIDTLVDATVAYLNAQIDAGAEAVQIFDSWAGLLATDEFARWAVAPVAKIVEAVEKKHPAVPIIGFPRGAGVNYLSYAAQTGVECVGIDQMLPPEWAAAHLQKFSTVQGNLDPLLLLAGGSALEQATRRILTALGKGPFVFNLGHGITPDVPPQNVARLADLIRAWHHRAT